MKREFIALTSLLTTLIVGCSSPKAQTPDEPKEDPREQIDPSEAGKETGEGLSDPAFLLYDKGTYTYDSYNYYLDDQSKQMQLYVASPDGSLIDGEAFARVNPGITLGYHGGVSCSGHTALIYADSIALVSEPDPERPGLAVNTGITKLTLVDLYTLKVLQQSSLAPSEDFALGQSGYCLTSSGEVVTSDDYGGIFRVDLSSDEARAEMVSGLEDVSPSFLIASGDCLYTIDSYDETAYRIDLAAGEAAPIALTDGTTPLRALQASEECLLVQGYDRRYYLYSMVEERAVAGPLDLGDVGSSAVYDAEGGVLYYAGGGKHHKELIYRYDLESREQTKLCTLVLADYDYEQSGQISLAKSGIEATLFVTYLSAWRQPYTALLDLQTGKLSNVTPHEGVTFRLIGYRP